MAESALARLYMIRGDLYAGDQKEKPQARLEYQAAVDKLSKLKATNQITLGGMKDLHEAQQKLRAAAS